jgi:hypothetical protein
MAVSTLTAMMSELKALFVLFTRFLTRLIRINLYDTVMTLIVPMFEVTRYRIPDEALEKIGQCQRILVNVSYGLLVLGRPENSLVCSSLKLQNAESDSSRLVVHDA